METINLATNTKIDQFDLRFVNISSLIVKVTNRCNLECKYCYEDIQKRGDNLPIETFKTLAHKAISSSINKKITFIFHGGEPTLVPIGWYAEATAFCNEIGRAIGKVVEFGIQTNLVSVSDEKLTVLSNLGIHISASIDATDETVSPERAFSAKTIKNFESARKLGVSVSVLSTINKSNYWAFGSFVKVLTDLGVKSFKANVAYPVGLGKYAEVLTREEIFEAKKAILDTMISERGLGINEVNLLKQVQKYFSKEDGCFNEVCDKKMCGAGKSVLAINSQGDILPCGRFSWNDTSYYLGSVYDDASTAVLEKKVDSFHFENDENWIDCDTCDAAKICNYGCKAFITRSIQKTNIECASTKLLWAYFNNHHQALEEVYKNNKSRMETGYGDYSDSNSYT
jgi:uncharacterized protein